MGTYFRVTHYCDGVDATALTAELTVVNRELSNYDPASELSRLNREPVGRWLPVSNALPQVLAASWQLHRSSDAAFDVTLAPVLRLWGFGPGAEPIKQEPSADALKRALAHVDAEALEWRAGAPAEVRRTADVEVDLSAIAKGHGVDRLAGVLEEAGCANYLVDIGGEVRARGAGRGGSGWRIGVEVPEPGQLGGIQRVLQLTDAGLATSGDYRNFVTVPDESGESLRRPHAIDPRTGEPVRHSLTSVTVVADTAMLADGWATALLVLGPAAGFELAKTEGLAALFLVRSASGFEERYTASFRPYLRSKRGEHL